ncbi:MAG: TIGR00153 family protein [Simkaniaceae bacterium]|nr:TIGR00153 family protein [Simkaniaceae bacterium]MCF7852577.1 TIGR00153 family protein [Simkaniaceae bacterium]
MLTIARLFGKSPFAPLQSHMEKVGACITKLSEIFTAIFNHQLDQIEGLVPILSKLEHEADLTKNDIRNHLPTSLFLPVDRSQILEILALQDSIADKAEEIGYLLTLKPFEPIRELHEGLKELFDKNIEAFNDTLKITKEMEQLLEASFGGMEAQRVKVMVDQTSYREYESDLLKHQLMKQFFAQADALSTPVFYMWIRLIEEIGQISHLCEKLAIRIRMILDLK